MSSPRELIRLRRGRVAATVSRRGASLRAVRVGEVALVEESDARDAPLAAGVVLVPWPNRVAGARWVLDGAPQQLAVTEPAAGNALHGLVADAVFGVRDVADDAVTLGARIADAPGYPFTLDVAVSYALAPDGIETTIGVRNVDDRTAPVAIGAHPYLRLGDADVGSLMLTVPAHKSVVLGDDALPRSVEPVAGTAFDLRRGALVRDIPWHMCLTAFDVRDGGIRAILGAPDAAVVLEADAAFGWLQVYVTDVFPGPSGAHTAVAVEPMSAPPDALNSGIGLRWLEPGARWAPRWRLRLETP